MYCQNCGKFIEGDAKLCAECETELYGKKTSDTDTTDTQSTPTDGQVPPTDTQIPPYQTPPYQGVPPYGYYNPGYYQPPMNPYAYSTEPEPQNRMFGFGKALTSLILGFFSYFFSVLAMALLSEDAAPVTGSAIVLLIAVGITATAFIFALQSIRCYQKRKATCIKPIPTLILGIIGISLSGLSIFILSLALLIFSVTML